MANTKNNNKSNQKTSKAALVGRDRLGDTLYALLFYFQLHSTYIAYCVLYAKAVPSTLASDWELSQVTRVFVVKSF